MQLFTPQRLAPRIIRRCAPTCAWLMLCCVGALVWGQVAAAQAPPAQFKSYTLRYKSAADVVRTLGQVLGDQAEMIVDEKGNRVLLRGPDSAHQHAARAIAALDQPQNPGNSAAPNGSGAPGNGVLAAPASAPPLNAPPARGFENNSAAERFVPLPWQANQVEPTLRSLFGARLVLLPHARPGISEYVVADRSGARVTLTTNPTQGGLAVAGPEPLASQVARLLQAHDGSRPPANAAIRTVSLRKADPQKVQQALDAYRRGNPAGAAGAAAPMNANRRANPIRLAQNPGAPAGAPAGGTAPGDAATAAAGAPAEEEVTKTQERLRELGLDLSVETLPDLDAIILRGNNRDVNEVLRIIEDIERLSAETVPTIEVYPLKYISSEALTPMLVALQRDLAAGRPGRVSVTALNKPNAVLLVGWGDAITAIKEVIEKLDQPVDPDTQLRVFSLKHAPAAATSVTIQEFFGKRTGLGPKVTVTPDVRSNALIVQAGPRDLAEVEHLISQIDTQKSGSVNQIRVFKLRNSLATNLAATLQAAMDSQRTGGGAAAAGAKSSGLELLTVDPLGEKIIRSGILTEVKITADARANTLIVSAPTENMELVAALIEQLDDSPVAVSQIKVFHIVNGDAPSLVMMLRALLPSQNSSGPGTVLARADGETSFAPLRYSVETRTNSIIAAGSAGDLAIVEALLLRLDEKDVQQRKNTVYQLKNAPALDVADAINQFLRSERLVQQAAPGTISPFQQIETEVVVVPEPVGNLLIISASPRYYDEIYQMVQKIDAQPPQVLIQVLIAEVALNDDRQFGIEFGLQDGLLFDRSLLGGLVTTDSTTTFGNPPTTVQTQTIQAATNTPGFDFNSKDIGNSGSQKSLATAAQVGGQSLSNFAVGRTSELGFGGLVLSASSKSISALLRALEQNQRLEVLSRPQVMTIDNQPAFIQVGQKVPRISNVTINQIGQNNSVVLENVGLILGVTPRISPEGMVVMEIDAEKSEVAPEIEGIPISVSASGAVVRSPRYNITTAQTTVSTASGETIVLGGLITKSEFRLDRRIPYISQIPVVGWLFRYDQFKSKRTELLIILTPHVVRSSDDAERMKQIEACRMHWCAADIHAIHGDPKFCRSGQCETCNAEMPVVYPDLDPRGGQPGWVPDEILPIDPDSIRSTVPDEGVSARKAQPAGRADAPVARNAANVPTPTQPPSARRGDRAAAPPATKTLPQASSQRLPPSRVAGSTSSAPAPETAAARPNVYPGQTTSYQGR